MPDRPLPSPDMDRLKRLLDGVNAFGVNPRTGGYNRIGYSAADMAARDWFANTMAADGLAVSRDAVGNVVGRYGPSDGAAIMIGSHLDTVPDGGAFDGALGVCVGLECVRAMRDAGIAPSRPVEVVATAEEEGRFGGMLGSQALAGQATAEWVGNAVDANGVRLEDVMRAQGLDPSGVATAARPEGSVAAFLELHIEQGPVLERHGRKVAIAHSVSGVCYLHTVLTGAANHSGTTPMDMRADAFAGLAEIAAGVSDILATDGSPLSRMTIGHVETQPNHPHTIPGRAEFSVIIRDVEETVMRRLRDAFSRRIEAVARRHGLGFDIAERSWLPPVALDPDLAGLLAEEAERLGLDAYAMPSGAGHDAQTMQALCPSALVFVPSRGGVSHAPDEWTDWDDVAPGARLMLAALVRLAVPEGA